MLSDRSIPWYPGTVKKRPEPERVQCGVRLEKNLVKVLKGLAEYLEISLAEVIELCALTAFDQPGGFSRGTVRRIQQLRQVYDVDYGLDDLRRRLFTDVK